MLPSDVVNPLLANATASDESVLSQGGDPTAAILSPADVIATGVKALPDLPA